jgi:hypothetical protein
MYMLKSFCNFIKTSRNGYRATLLGWLKIESSSVNPSYYYRADILRSDPKRSPFRRNLDLPKHIMQRWHYQKLSLCCIRWTCPSLQFFVSHASQKDIQICWILRRQGINIIRSTAVEDLSSSPKGSTRVNRFVRYFRQPPRAQCKTSPRSVTMKTFGLTCQIRHNTLGLPHRRIRSEPDKLTPFQAEMFEWLPHDQITQTHLKQRVRRSLPLCREPYRPDSRSAEYHSVITPPGRDSRRRRPSIHSIPAVPMVRVLGVWYNFQHRRPGLITATKRPPGAAYWMPSLAFLTARSTTWRSEHWWTSRRCCSTSPPACQMTLTPSRQGRSIRSCPSHGLTLSS